MTWPASICVVGGGTAGWLAAMVLGRAARAAGAACAVTVIESSKIPTVGVGEGTTAAFRILLQKFGIDEFDFLARTGASFKLGIRHKDWRRKGHAYEGPIDDPYQVSGLPEPLALDAVQVARGERVGETHLFQHLIDRARAPWAPRGEGFVQAGPYQHAFHFDQALVGRYLKAHAPTVEVIDDQVEGVETGPEGIAALKLQSGRRVTAEVYFDCTGFRRALVGALEHKWQSYRGILPVTRGLPFWIDLEPGEEMDPVTLAWAQGSGWIWRIPTQGRYGCGYVYSDAHIGPDEALAEIEAAFGRKIEPRGDIRINAGRLEDAWIGNCIALGLASSFVEPLEATSIHGSVVQLIMLTTFLAENTPAARARYNEIFRRQIDDFRDFIRLHYVSERRDTPFWQDMAASIPDGLRAKLAHWQRAFPRAEEFPTLPGGLPHVTHHLHMPVLDGLGLLPAAPAKAWLAARPKLRAHARKQAESLQREYRMAAGKAAPHRAFLTSLSERTSS